MVSLLRHIHPFPGAALFFFRVYKNEISTIGMCRGSEGEGEDILFLNNETRHLQMSRITLKHMF